MKSFEQEIKLIGAPENSVAPTPRVQKHIPRDLHRELKGRRLDNQHFVKEEQSWNPIVKITITAYSQIICEKDPGLTSKMEKHHERPLSLNSHSGL